MQYYILMKKIETAESVLKSVCTTYAKFYKVIGCIRFRSKDLVLNIE